MLKTFFCSKKWQEWSCGGGIILILSLWLQVQMSVASNEWYGRFYNHLQNARQFINSPSDQEQGIFLFFKHLIDFSYYTDEIPRMYGNLLGFVFYLEGKEDLALALYSGISKAYPSFSVIIIPYILLAMFTNWFTRMYGLRWRQAITFDYIPRWRNVEKEIEGASQRIQEDCSKFARIVESLGLQIVRALMTLIAFAPLLWEISKKLDAPFAVEQIIAGGFTVSVFLIAWLCVSHIVYAIAKAKTECKVKTTITEKMFFGNGSAWIKAAFALILVLLVSWPFFPEIRDRTDFGRTVTSVENDPGQELLLLEGTHEHEGIVVDDYYTTILAWITIITSNLPDTHAFIDLGRTVTLIENDGGKIVEFLEGAQEFKGKELLRESHEAKGNVIIIDNYVPGSLVWLAFIVSIGGLLVSWFVGSKLPGLEYNNQVIEAAFRKELVYGEDDKVNYAHKETLFELFTGVRFNYQRLYLHYGYFDLWMVSYDQLMIIVPYLIVGPGLFTGLIALGFMVQVSNAFQKVHGGFSLFLHNWTTITELRSIWKRLSEFEENLDKYKMTTRPALQLDLKFA